MKTLLNPSIYYLIGYTFLSLLLPSHALAAEPGTAWPTANILPGDAAHTRAAMNAPGSISPGLTSSGVDTNSQKTAPQPDSVQPLSNGGQFSKMRTIGGYGRHRGSGKSKGSYRKSRSAKKSSCKKKKKRSSCSRKKSSYSKSKKKKCGRR